MISPRRYSRDYASRPNSWALILLEVSLIVFGDVATGTLAEATSLWQAFLKDSGGRFCLIHWAPRTSSSPSTLEHGWDAGKIAWVDLRERKLVEVDGG